MDPDLRCYGNQGALGELMSEYQMAKGKTLDEVWVRYLLSETMDAINANGSMSDEGLCCIYLSSSLHFT